MDRESSQNTVVNKKGEDDNAKNEDGKEIPKLALEEFFQIYVDKWYREKKVNAILYNKCRDEIDQFKGKVKKRRKAKQISKESLDAIHIVELLPDLHGSKLKISPEIRSKKQVSKESKEKPPKKQVNEESKEKPPKKLVNEQSKEKSVPASVPQEQYEMIIKKHQKALARIQDLEDEKAELILENDSISSHVEHLKGELKRSYAQIDDIKSRYSKLASEALKNNNPNIADLSDPYRPTEITKHFSELYDNEWSDAYEALTTTLKCSEEESLRILFDTVESSFEYMEGQREQQVQLIRQVLLHPVSFTLTNEDKKMEDLNKFIAKENIEIQIKEIRKTHAPTTAKILAKVFRDIELERLLAPHEKITNSMPEALKKYAYQCALLSWHMVVADPPIDMAKAVAGKPFDLERYRPYTKSIKGPEKVVVEVDVWPALYLHAGGSLLNKGVAQPGPSLWK